MNLLSYGKAHQRTDGGSFWVIEHNTARQERCERIHTSTHSVEHDEGWITIRPDDILSGPVRYIPLHMVAEFSYYPAVNA